MRQNKQLGTELVQNGGWAVVELGYMGKNSRNVSPQFHVVFESRDGGDKKGDPEEDGWR